MEKSVFKTLPRKAKIGIIAGICAVAVICCVVVTIVFISNKSPENNSILVYKKGSETVVRINDKEKTVDKTAENFKADKENARVYFLVQSSYDDELFDLCYLEFNKGEISDSKLIDYGIESDYALSDGDIFYRKYNKNAAAYDGCVSDVESKKIKVFSANVENIYPLAGSECVYFTKNHAENRVIYKYDGDSSKEFCRNVSSVYYYPESENPHVIFERESGVGADVSEVYIAYADSSPEMICDTASEVFYESYEPGGNLYYFSTSQESVSWGYVISDEFAESDKTITEPRREDFFSFFGISIEYNEAYRAYQDKMIRDEIRTELDNNFAENGISVPAFTAFAYNSDGVHKVAENVDPSRVYTVAPKGEPQIVYESVEVKANVTDMATLSEIAAKSGMDEVIAFACEIVETSSESKGMMLAVNDGENGKSFSLSEYDKSKTQFAFSDNGKYLFAMVRDNHGGRYSIYSNALNGESAPDSNVTVSTNVIDFRTGENSIIYLKTDDGKTSGDVFSFDGGENLKLCNSASAFRVELSDDVYFMKNYDELAEEPLADFYGFYDGDEVVLDKNIIVSSFYSTNGKAAYLVKNGDEAELKIYEKGKSALVCEDVTQILLVS